MKYLEDLGVDLETVEFLIPLEIVQAPAIGEMTKSTFVTGWKNIG
jgi:DCN1-like protein 1/2